VVDGAGNESDTTHVDTVRWTATLRGKIPGRSSPNPHRATFTGELAPSLAQNALLVREPDGDEYRALAAIDSEVATVGARRIWREHDLTLDDATLSAGPASIAYDDTRGTLVLIGSSDHLFERTGTRWTDRTISGDHPASSGHTQLAYASRLGATIVLGD